MTSCLVDEVFASVQGEGPWAGQWHIFVRFIGCDLACGYCDTPGAVKAGETAAPCQAQRSAASFERELVPNPLTADVLSGLCRRLTVPGPSKPVLSLTGGEPLLQTSFLLDWLPAARTRFSIYLETSGIHHEKMRTVRELVDIVSMDIKLPSATRQAARWDEHGKFLAAAAGSGLFAKAVVTNETSDEDVIAAARLLAWHDRRTLLVLQPASGGLAPAREDLLRLQGLALELLEDVRVIPQLHRMLGLP